MAYSGRFRPRNPQKYIGDHQKIFWRSTWELRVMRFFDENPDILAWGSEELVIPYISPVDGRQHRYFPDMIIKVMKDGIPRTYVVEIKPENQTVEPKVRKRVTKRYISEVTTYGINQAKWAAATEYCKDRGWEFKIITEKDLGIR